MHDWNATTAEHPDFKVVNDGNPTRADEIKEAISIGFHLKCLRCGKTYYLTRFSMSEMGYRKYSYCDDCIDKAMTFLKNETAKSVKSEWLEDSDPGQEYGSTWACRMCMRSLHEQHVWNPYDCGWRYCPGCGRRMVRNLGDETESRVYDSSKCGGMGTPSCETCDMVCPYR